MIAIDRLDRVSCRLLFTTGDDAFQNAIRLSTGSDATHAALALGDGGKTLLHAYEDGVQLDDRDRWLGPREQRVVAEYQILPDVTDGIAEALSHVGKRYDVVHVVKIAVMRILRIARLGRPQDDGAFTCARFVMQIGADGQIPEWRGLHPDAVVPKDLMERAESGTSFYRLA